MDSPTAIICILAMILFIVILFFFCRPSEAQRKEKQADKAQAFDAELTNLILFLNRKCKEHNQNIEAYLRRGEPNHFKLDLHSDILSTFPLFGEDVRFREELWRRGGFSFKRKGSSIYFHKENLPGKDEKFVDYFF